MALALAAMLIAGAALAAGGDTYVVRDHTITSQLLWNDQRALLIAGVRRDGWSGTRLRYLIQVIAGLLGRPFQFGESRMWVVVADISGTAVNRVVLDRETIRFVYPFEGQLYQSSDLVTKWDGSSFKRVPPSEAARFRTSHPTDGVSYSNVDGWSSRVNLLNQGDSSFDYLLRLSEVEVLVVADRSNRHHPRLTVRHGGKPEVEIISLDERFRVIAATEYASLLNEPHSSVLVPPKQ